MLTTSFMRTIDLKIVLLNMLNLNSKNKLLLIKTQAGIKLKLDLDQRFQNRRFYSFVKFKTKRL